MPIPLPSPGDFGRVAVCAGGQSAEREISLASGAAVEKALLAEGVKVERVDLNRQFFQRALAGDFDRVFIALHGSGGEDGALQGFLDSINLPYTGSNAAASLTGMDKKLSKLVWQAQGLPTPAWQMVADLHALEQAVQTLGLPLMVKPVSEGSSIGMSLLETHEQIASAWQLAAGQGQPVMTERYIQGDEYTAGLVAGETLPLIRITTANKFYDFEAKYQSDETGYHCPAGLDNDQEQSLRVLASEAFTAIGGSGWGRIDLMVDADRRPWLIEANTVPGLTDHSLLPMAAAATGWNFNQLALAILSTSMGQGETADGRRVFNG